MTKLHTHSVAEPSAAVPPPLVEIGMPATNPEPDNDRFVPKVIGPPPDTGTPAAHDAAILERFFIAVFGDGHTEGDVVIGTKEAPHVTRDLEFIYSVLKDGTGCGVSLVTVDKEREDYEFVAASAKLTPNSAAERALAPSFTIFRGDERFGVWLLRAPMTTDLERLFDVNRVLNGKGTLLRDFLPLPGWGGWQVSPEIDNPQGYTLEELEAAFPRKFQDATIYGVLDPELLEKKISIGFSDLGSDTRPGKWKTLPDIQVKQLIAKLSKHEIGDKEGSCILQGPCIDGIRTANSMEWEDILMLDLDTGEDRAVTRQRVAELNVAALLYTTHSHMKPMTDIPHDAFIKWNDNKPATEESVRRYLTEEKRYQPAIVENITLGEPKHKSKGIMLPVHHAPMPKFRVVLFLKEPFVFAKRGTSQKDAIIEWHERYAGVAKLLGAAYDRSCVDPSRLMFLPRHKKGMPFHVDIIAGKPLDLDTVERVSSGKGKKNDFSVFETAAHDMGASKADTTKEYKTLGLLKFLAKYGESFEAEDFIRELDPDGDRGARSGGKPGYTWRCPNDDMHTDAGNELDMGFFVINGTESDGGAVMHCQHDSCSKLDRADYIDLLCQQFGEEHGIDHASKLKKWCAATEENGLDEEEDAEQPDEKASRPSHKFKKPDDVGKVIALLDEPDAESVEAILSGVAQMSPTALTPIARDRIVKDLSKATGVGVRVLSQTLKRMQTLGLDDDAELDEKLHAYNKEFAFAIVGGKSKIIRLPPKMGVAHDIMGVRDFYDLKRPDQHELDGDDGNPKKFPVAELWMKWQERRQFPRGIKFAPGSYEQGEAYNSWQGWGVQARAGDWSKLREHIFRNLCKGNIYHFVWVICWLADVFQDPQHKKGTAIVFQGGQGTGKSILVEFIQMLMPANCITLNKPKHLTSGFNSHLTNMLIVVADDTFLAETRSVGDVLKDMISNHRQVVEHKGCDAYEDDNFMRILAISNHDRVIWADADERRWMVLRVSSDRASDHDYFGAMKYQMKKEGGLQAFLYDLERLPKPKSINLRKAPDTDALRVQKEHSGCTVTMFVKTILTEGEIVIWDEKSGTSRAHHFPKDADNPETGFVSLAEGAKIGIGKAAMYAAYKHATPRDTKAPNKFHATLATLLPSVCESRPDRQDFIIGSNGGRVYTFPGLETLVKDFKKATGQTLTRDGSDHVAPAVDAGEYIDDEWKEWRAYALGEGPMPAA